MNKNLPEGAGSILTRPIYNKEGIFKLCLACISAVIAIFTGILFGTGFDTETLYFENTSASCVFGGVMATAVVAIIVFSVILKAQISPAKRKATSLLQYLGAIVLFLFFLQSIIDKNLWLIIFSLIATAYFIGLSGKHYIANTLLGIGTVLFYGATIAQTYLDYSIAVNSPYKLLCHFGMAISMLLIASELKFDLGGGRQAAYSLISGLTFALNASASAASIALVLSGAKNINYFLIPCAAMAIYSAKIFFAQPIADAQDTDINPDEKGTDTDEILN